MSHFFNIVKKEVKELLTPTTFIPIIVMALVFGSIGNMIGGAFGEATEKPIIGIVDTDCSTYSSIIRNVSQDKGKLIYNGSSEDDINEGLNILKENGGIALLFIPENFSWRLSHNLSGLIHTYWIMKGAGIMDGISSGAVESILYEINQKISVELMKGKNLNTSLVLSPVKKREVTIFKNKEMKDISPAILGDMLSSQSTTVPIIMMIIIIMAGGMVISSMAMEKENKTLETLLTLPVRRSAIVTGKIVGSAIVGLLMAVIYMIGFSYYLQSFQRTSEINLADYGLTLGTEDYILIGISVFLALFSALSLCMVLGTFAKNYKSAQTLTVPISILALIPMFIIMFRDFDTLPSLLKIVLFAIPFSHPMMAMRSLVFGDYILVISGIVYVAIFALSMIIVAVRIFNSDKLLIGKISSKNKLRQR